MEEKLKYRLVGAAVILALMAFFLPLILDSKKYKTEIVSQIPPMPASSQNAVSDESNSGGLDLPSDSSTNKSSNDNQTKTKPEPLVIELDKKPKSEVDDADSVPTEDNAKDAPEVLSQTKDAEKPAYTKTKDLVAAEPKVEVKPTETVQKAVDSMKSETQDVVTKPAEVIQQTAKKPAEAVKITPPDFKESAYVIQIGSFSNKDNASKLVADLRKQDYRAYQRVSENFSRVFVGPYPEKSIADSRSAKLAQIVGNSVKVIEFDPIKH